MLEIKEKHEVKIDNEEIGFICIDIKKQGYVFIPRGNSSLAWDDMYEIQCKLSDLNENYAPF